MDKLSKITKLAKQEHDKILHANFKDFHKKRNQLVDKITGSKQSPEQKLASLSKIKSYQSKDMPNATYNAMIQNGVRSGHDVNDMASKDLYNTGADYNDFYNVNKVSIYGGETIDSYEDSKGKEHDIKPNSFYKLEKVGTFNPLDSDHDALENKISDASVPFDGTDESQKEADQEVDELEDKESDIGYDIGFDSGGYVEYPHMHKLSDAKMYKPVKPTNQDIKKISYDLKNNRKTDITNPIPVDFSNKKAFSNYKKGLTRDFNRNLKTINKTRSQNLINSLGIKPKESVAHHVLGKSKSISASKHTVKQPSRKQSRGLHRNGPTID